VQLSNGLQGTCIDIGLKVERGESKRAEGVDVRSEDMIFTCDCVIVIADQREAREMRTS
jgi:hypothetical protein